MRYSEWRTVQMEYDVPSSYFFWRWSKPDLSMSACTLCVSVSQKNSIEAKSLVLQRYWANKWEQETQPGATVTSPHQGQLMLTLDLLNIAIFTSPVRCVGADTGLVWTVARQLRDAKRESAAIKIASVWSDGCCCDWLQSNRNRGCVCFPYPCNTTINPEGLLDQPQFYLRGQWLWSNQNWVRLHLRLKKSPSLKLRRTARLRFHCCVLAHEAAVTDLYIKESPSVIFNCHNKEFSSRWWV